MTHHTISCNFKSLSHHPPIRCDFVFSVEPGDRSDFWRQDPFTYISINASPFALKSASVETVESPIPVSNILTGKQWQFFQSTGITWEKGHLSLCYLESCQYHQKWTPSFFFPSLLITGNIRAVIQEQSNWRAIRNSLGVSLSLCKQKIAPTVLGI